MPGDRIKAMCREMNSFHMSPPSSRGGKGRQRPRKDAQPAAPWIPDALKGGAVPVLRTHSLGVGWVGNRDGDLNWGFPHPPPLSENGSRGSRCGTTLPMCMTWGDSIPHSDPSPLSTLQACILAPLKYQGACCLSLGQSARTALGSTICPWLVSDANRQLFNNGRPKQLIPLRLTEPALCTGSHVWPPLSSVDATVLFQNSSLLVVRN